MQSSLTFGKAYKDWLSDIKARVRNAQIKAAVKVNTEMLDLYWELGADIVEKQKKAKWGDGLIDRLSKDLSTEFPDIKGFSRRNLMYMKKWYLFYSREKAIVQQSVGQFSQQAVGQLVQQAVALIKQIPWGHNIAIISQCRSVQEALYYVQKTIAHNWSRSVLNHQMDNALHKREGKAISNFTLTLPKLQSDLAHETLKDPYMFDFLSMADDYDERDLEKGLLDHLTKFLLELGAGFAFIGKQYHVQVGAQEFYIDLLFYHVQLHCYVVIELKTKNFEPGFTGQLNFYIKAVDMQLRKKGDQPTIGLLLCRNKDKLVAEYALSDIGKPIGISEYKLTHSFPKNLKSSLPTIEEIEKELSKL